MRWITDPNDSIVKELRDWLGVYHPDPLVEERPDYREPTHQPPGNGNLVRITDSLDLRGGDGF